MDKVIDAVRLPLISSAIILQKATGVSTAESRPKVSDKFFGETIIRKFSYLEENEVGRKLKHSTST